MTTTPLTVELRGRNKLPQIAAKVGIGNIVEDLLVKVGLEGNFTLMLGDKGHIGGTDRPAIKVIGISGHAVQVTVCTREQEHRYKCFLSGNSIKASDLIDKLREECKAGWWFHDDYLKAQKIVTNGNGRHTIAPPIQPLEETPEEMIEQPTSIQQAGVQLKGLFEEETNLVLLLDAMITRYETRSFSSIDFVDILKEDFRVSEVTNISPYLRSLQTSGFISTVPGSENPKRYTLTDAAFGKVGKDAPQRILEAPKSREESVVQSKTSAVVNGHSPNLPSNSMLSKIQDLYVKVEAFKKAEKERAGVEVKMQPIKAEIDRLEKALAEQREKLDVVAKELAPIEKTLKNEDYSQAEKKYNDIMRIVGLNPETGK